MLPGLRTEQEARQQLSLPQTFGIAALQTVAATIYTATTDFLIEHLWVANVTGGSLTYTLYFVPDGGAAGAGNTAVFQKALAANTSEVVAVASGHRVPPGTAIAALCSANDGINLGGWGFEQYGAYA